MSNVEFKIGDQTFIYDEQVALRNDEFAMLRERELTPPFLWKILGIDDATLSVIQQRLKQQTNEP